MTAPTVEGGGSRSTGTTRKRQDRTVDPVALSAYETFLHEKVHFDRSYGFDIAADEINPMLLPHQADLVRWAIRGGRRAIFAAFGLGKTFIQLEVLRLITEHRGGPALLVIPLGVRSDILIDAKKLGIKVTFIRRDDQITGSGIFLTNYEAVREGNITPALFTAASLDEASVLRSFGSKTYQTFLDLFASVAFRFVATATPSPNRYKELIHYAGYLGVMDTGQALTRFFQRNSEKAGDLTLYPHKEFEFYLWLNTWAAFVQRPSDICRCSCHVRTSTSRGSALAASSPSNGGQQPAVLADGSADATAAPTSSSRRASSRPAAPEAAAASDLDMVARDLAPTQSGEGCATDAPARSTRTGPTTAVAGSLSVNDGATSETSSTTWESPLPGAASTGSITTDTTNPATAGGRPRPSRPAIGAPGRSESCDACRCDDGYSLPTVELRFHELDVEIAETTDRDGQGRFITGGGISLQEAARARKSSIAARVTKAAELVAASPDDRFILWHDLEDERREITRQLGDEVSEVFGSLDLDLREDLIVDFGNGVGARILATKPILSGSGCNFQRHCHRAVFVGVDFKFNDWWQAVHRIYRFLQTEAVVIDIIHTSAQRDVVETLMQKRTQHEELTERMSDIVREFGLDTGAIEKALIRTMGVSRLEASGDGWLVANNDTIPETQSMGENTVDLIVTSIPFSNHYEYTPAYEDFGHTDDNAHFWEQMDFLTPELLRVLRPGRIYACHVKDRILFGGVTGAGVPISSPFHAEAIFHAQKHGFDYLGMVTVVTDVVRENNQTYRLGWTEMAKDGTKMGVGSPEYILLFHKPQTDRTKGYADVPVVKSKTDYTRARWQLDAHSFWRSDGNRSLTPDELAALRPDEMSRLFTEQTLRQVYDFESHVQLGEVLEGRGALPATFMSLAPGSWHPEVWHDVNRMLTLNGSQKQRNLAMHVCPLQFDIVDRLIERYSNPGDLVYDPFGGLFTVPLRAMKAGRRGRAVELNPGYFLDGVKYLEAEERKQTMPTLFDLATVEEAAA